MLLHYEFSCDRYFNLSEIGLKYARSEVLLLRAKSYFALLLRHMAKDSLSEGIFFATATDAQWSFSLRHKLASCWDDAQARLFHLSIYICVVSLKTAMFVDDGGLLSTVLSGGEAGTASTILERAISSLYISTYPYLSRQSRRSRFQWSYQIYLSRHPDFLGDISAGRLGRWVHQGASIQVLENAIHNIWCRLHIDRVFPIRASIAELVRFDITYATSVSS